MCPAKKGEKKGAEGVAKYYEVSGDGYRQIITHLQGSLSLTEAETEIKRATRVLVRRQANWFKVNDPGIHWFDLSTTGDNVILEFIRSWLGSNPTAVI